MALQKKWRLRKFKKAAIFQLVVELKRRSSLAPRKAPFLMAMKVTRFTQLKKLAKKAREVKLNATRRRKKKRLNRECTKTTVTTWWKRKLQRKRNKIPSLSTRSLQKKQLPTMQTLSTRENLLRTMKNRMKIMKMI
jgi:G:T/U-mismatch repair DNA glycosylase